MRLSQLAGEPTRSGCSSGLVLRPTSKGDGRQHDEGPRRASDDLQRQTRPAGRRQYPGSTCAMVALVVEYAVDRARCGHPRLHHLLMEEGARGEGGGCYFPR